MNVAILKSDGTPIKLDASFPGDKKFDPNGFLLSFNYKDQGAYQYYQNKDFKKADSIQYKDLEGYYLVTEYLKYIQDVGSNVPTINQLRQKFKFKSAQHLASVGEPVIIDLVDFGKPFSYFYKIKKFSFNVESTSDNSGQVKNYKRTFIENFKLIDYEINIPASATSTTTEISLATEPTGYFFWNNFGKHVGSWTISDVQKSRFKKLFTLIAFRINQIVENIFPKLLSSTAYAAVNAVANRTNSDISDGSELEQMVFNLKKLWGYYYIPAASPSLFHRHDFPAIFSDDPNIEEVESYFGSITNFYLKIYKIQDELLAKSEGERLQYLIETLPSGALGILPLSTITSALKKLVRINRSNEEDERFIVKLVMSVAAINANDFLDFLLQKPDEKATYFECLYNLLDDARLERYPIVNWFVDEQPNRKYFAYAVYELWKKSKYNWEYVDPSGTPPYFNQNSTELNPVNILTFQTNKKIEDDTPTYIDVKFGTYFKNNKIQINTRTIYHRYYDSGQNDLFPVVESESETSSPFGLFHLYHPVSLVGYQPNQDLAIPKKNTIPAFLFHFAKEYDELADFDAGVKLIINITIDVLLTYFTGGANLLSELRYLRNITQIGRALRGTLNPSTAVELWRGLENTTEIVTLTAASLANINEYLSTTENDENKRKILEENQKLFLGLMLLSGGLTVFSRSQAVASAKKVFNLIELLPPGVPHGLSLEHINLIEKLAGELSGFGALLDDLDLGTGATNHISTKFALFNSEQKLAFWKDFQHRIDDVGFWKKLNSGVDGKYLDNWQSLYNLGLKEAGYITLITDQKFVNGIIRYYTPVELRKLLAALSIDDKVRLMEEFGDIHLSTFLNIVEKPENFKLIIEYQRRIKIGPDIFEKQDIIDIINSSLKASHIELLSVKCRYTLADLILRYPKEIKDVQISVLRLKSLHRENAFGDFVSTLLPDNLYHLRGSNRLTAKIKIFQEGSSVGSEITEKYVSGGEFFVRNDIFNGNIPEEIIEPDYLRFNIFNKKARSLTPEIRNRENDTELKFIFNLIDEHWNKGDEFLIELESTLYACESCRGYLLYLKELASQQGKIININFISHNQAIRIKDVKNLTK